MLVLVLIAVFCVLNARVCHKKSRTAGGIVLLTIAACLFFFVLGSYIMMMNLLPKVGYDLSAMSAESIEDMSKHMMEIAQELNSSYGTRIIIGTYLTVFLGGLVGLFAAWRMKPYEEAAAEHENKMKKEASRARRFQENHESAGRQDPAGMRTPSSGGGTPSGGAQSGGSLFGGRPETPQDAAAAAQAAQAVQVFDPETMIDPPCTICIFRDPDALGAEETYSFSLNGEPVCKLINQSYTVIYTRMKQNTITGRREDGSSLHKPVTFPAMSGGTVEIHVQGDSFRPERTTAKLA